MGQKTTEQATTQTTQRFATVTLALAWVRVMQKMDEFKGLSHAELVKKATDDVVSKRVTAEDIEKLAKKAAAAAAAAAEAAAEKPAAAAEEPAEDAEDEAPKKKK